MEQQEKAADDAETENVQVEGKLVLDRQQVEFLNYLETFERQNLH